MKKTGFTLVEMLLIMVVISVLLMLSVGYSQQKLLNMQIDRTSLQMQQLLNAGLAYYVNHGEWPVNTSDPTDFSKLQGTYLPPSTAPIKSPWGTNYNMTSVTTITDNVSNNVLNIYFELPINVKNQDAIVEMIAGKLPLARIKGYDPGGWPTNPPCGGMYQPACIPAPEAPASVWASVNIPGQDLNNATSLNFAGLYHHGACVPIPACPVDVLSTETSVQLKPQVFLVPVSVSGVNDDTSVGSSPNVYPLSSFTAFATISSPPDTVPPACEQSPPYSKKSDAPTCVGTTSPTGTFWRACIQVVTERGDVAATRTESQASGNESDSWGHSVTLAAFTRCAHKLEPSGSPISSYSN